MTKTVHTDYEAIVARRQLTPTNISTGKKGLGGSVIAGAIIGGLVVLILIIAVFYGLRHRYRRSKGQTASTMEAGPENEKEGEKCAELSEDSHGHYPTSVAICPLAGAQGAQSDTTVCQTRPIASPSSPRRSFDSSQGYPNQTNYGNITTHAPRPQCYKTRQAIHSLDPSSPPCMSCALSTPSASCSTGGDISLSSPKDAHQAYDKRSCAPPTSPPLPPGAMPPLPSPTLESYEQQFKFLPPQSPPQSPPPQSPSSPGGSTIRRWIMSPLSRSGTIRSALPPYEQPASGLQRRASDKKDEKKDESFMASEVYTFM